MKITHFHELKTVSHKKNTLGPRDLHTLVTASNQRAMYNNVGCGPTQSKYTNDRKMTLSFKISHIKPPQQPELISFE